MLLMLGREQERLDVTHDRDGPYLGTHIANSAEQTSTMLPNPRMAPVKGAC
jgi:hypothetical protein